MIWRDNTHILLKMRPFEEATILLIWNPVQKPLSSTWSTIWTLLLYRLHYRKETDPPNMQTIKRIAHSFSGQAKMPNTIKAVLPWQINRFFLCALLFLMHWDPCGRFVSMFVSNTWQSCNFINLSVHIYSIRKNPEFNS